MRFGTSARIAAGLAVIAVVVAVNQIHGPNAPHVLGAKLTPCAVDGARVTSGPRRIQATTLTVTVLHGKAVAALVPPVRLNPNETPAPVAKPAAALAMGAAKSSHKGVAILTVRLTNSSDCSVAFSKVTVTARRTASAIESSSAKFSGADRVVVKPGHFAKSQVSLDVKTDGSWEFNASATADVGASS